MKPRNRIYHSTVHWRLNMFRAAYRSSSGTLTVFAASGLHTYVVTGRSQVWVGTHFPLRLDYGRSPHAYVNQRLQIQLEFLMMRGMPLETCWAFNWVPTQTWLRPVTTCVCKPEAANTVRVPDDERYAARNMLSLQLSSHSDLTTAGHHMCM